MPKVLKAIEVGAAVIARALIRLRIFLRFYKAFILELINKAIRYRFYRVLIL